MLCAAAFSPDQQAAFGPLPIGCIYLVAIFTSSLASAVYLPNELTVGASGAVFGRHDG